MSQARRLPIGAEVLPEGGLHFRVWAPRRRRVEVVLEQSAPGRSGALIAELEPEGDGYFSGRMAAAATGMRYRFRLDGERALYPDPASRFQPEGPHGPSQVIDPARFRWTDADWRGADLHGQVIYEMHIGTFTREGTWEAATRELPELATLGHHGAGGDAGRRLPRPLRLGLRRRRPVRADAALRHARRLPPLRRSRPQPGHRRDPRCRLQPPRPRRQLPQAVLRGLLHRPLRERMGRRRSTSTVADAGPVREFFVANAGYWIDEFHLDGLRLDATQQIFDRSPEHILAAIGRRVRAAARGRATLIVAENEPQDAQLVRPLEKGGYGLDALWNDDFHHSAMVALTGHNEAYYTRLPRHAAGVHLGGQVGLSLSGPALPVAEEAARHAGPGPGAGALRQLHREPRPGRQLGPRTALPRTDQSRVGFGP